MIDTATKIAAGLERAFATRGFAEPSVEDLRDASGVSLRTLYKYVPSRSEMVIAALEHRHQRYLGQVFDDLPSVPEAALETLLGRVSDWMATETSHGCLFHAAVAADPSSAQLREVLARHKAEVAQRASIAADLPAASVALLLIIEGLTQTWPLHREAATDCAIVLGRALQAANTEREIVVHER